MGVQVPPSIQLKEASREDRDQLRGLPGLEELKGIWGGLLSSLMMKILVCLMMKILVYLMMRKGP
jgi:hypothetical protein